MAPNVFYHIFRNGSVTSGSSNSFGADNEDEDEEDQKYRGSTLLRVMESGDIDTSMDRPDGTPNLSGKQRMLMKQGRLVPLSKDCEIIVNDQSAVWNYSESTLYILCCRFVVYSSCDIAPITE